MKDLIFTDLKTLLKTNSNYQEDYKNHLDLIEANLWKNLDKIPDLSEEKINKVMNYFLSLACQCQHIMNIQLGRASLLALPKSWLLKNIGNYAEPLLNDEWEYRRLLEVSWKIDNTLVLELIKKGVSHSNLEIRELAEKQLEELRNN